MTKKIYETKENIFIIYKREKLILKTHKNV